MTSAEVERAVEAGWFRYDGEPGERSFATGRPTKWGADLGRYATREGDSVSVGVGVENTTALDNPDEILSVPEIGFVFVGHGDLSVSLDQSLEMEHEDVRSAIETTRTACLDSGVPVGGSVSDADAASELLPEGYSLAPICDENRLDAQSVPSADERTGSVRVRRVARYSRK